MHTSRSSEGPPILRMGHLLAFSAFLGHVGAPVEKHLRRHGLPTLCEDPDEFVSLAKAWAFFDTAARSEDPAIGWHVGQFVGSQNLNRSLLSKLEYAPSLLQALQRLIRLSSTEASHVKLGIRERRDDILLFTHYPTMKGVPGYTISQSYQLGLLFDLIRHFTGADWMPKEIGIEQTTASNAAEELFPGSRILASREFGYLTIPRSCLHLAPPRNPLEEEAGSDGPVILNDRLDQVGTLRALLKPYLPEGYPHKHLAASLVGTSERTLNRKLAEFGLTYRDLIDELRFNKARSLLENTDEPVIDVAYAVGFEDPANFTRMFRRIGGSSPSEFRKTKR